MAPEELSPLLDHLEHSGISRGTATRVVAEVLAYFSETTRGVSSAGVTESCSVKGSRTLEASP